MTEVRVDVVVDDDDPRLASPFVRCEVDGRTERLLLDSGARRSRIVEEPTADATDAGAGSEGTGAFGTSLEERRREVGVRFGGRDLGRIELAVTPPGRGERGGLVGQDVLSRFRCEYRLWQGLLRLDPSPPTDAKPIHIDAGGHLHLELTWVDGARADGVFDTGASVTVVDSGWARDHPTLFHWEGTAEGTDASGATLSTRMATMAGPTILDHRFADAVVAEVDLSAANEELDRRMDLIVGWPLIRQATWVFDHVERTGAVRPAPRWPHAFDDRRGGGPSSSVDPRGS
jgi:hypothetical protein